MRIAVYLRVSTQLQAQAQTSEQQLERLRARIQQAGWTLRDEHIFRDDGYSGASLNRPGLDALRDQVKAGEVERVLITAPDRLARNYVHQMVLLEELQRAGCAVEFLDRPMSDDPHDQLLLQIRGAVAEYERTLIAERMRRGRQRKLQAGALLPWTHVPYGYRVNPDRPRDPAGVQRDEAEAAVIQEMFAWYLAEGASLAGLTRHLQALGLSSPRGLRRWNQATVRGILMNPAYTGQVYLGRTQLRAPRMRRSATHPIGRPAYGRTATPSETWIPVAGIPTIISQTVYDQAQAKLAHNQQFARRNNTAHDYLLRALVSCGACNLACTGRGRGQYRYYVCCGKAPPSQSCRDERCSARLIPAGQLDDLVWQDVCEVLSHPELIAYALERAHGGHWLPQELQARRETLRKGRVQLQSQLERLSEAYLHGIIPLAEYERRRRDLEQKDEALDAQARQLEAQVDRQAELAGLVASVEAFCGRVQAGLAQANFEQKRQLVELLIDRVVVTHDEVEIRYVIPTSQASEQVRFCHLRKDYFCLPAQDKPLDNLPGFSFQVCAQEGLGLELALRIADQHPANGQGRQTAVKPDCRLRDDLDHALALAIPVPDRDALPARLGIGRNGYQSRQALPFLARAALRTGFALRGRFVQRGVQPQPDNQAELARQLRQPKQPQNRGKFTISDDDQQPVRQPAPQLHDHLSAPIGYLLVRARSSFIVAFRRRQAVQEGQSPHPSRPGNRRQQHQTQPTQPTRLHEVRLARAHWVAIDALRFDLGASSALECGVEGADDRSFGHERLHQQLQQCSAQRPTRPHRAVEHPVVGLELALLTQAHDAQHRGHGPATRGQDRAQQQDAGMLPNAVGKVRRERLNQAIMPLGQGWHRHSSWSRIAVAYPAPSRHANG